MTNDQKDRQTSTDIDLLTRAFDSFNVASDALKRSYESLQQEIKQLDLELKRKNSELEQNVRTLESVRNYLTNVLQSIQNGVISVDSTGQVRTINRAARAMFGLQGDSPPNVKYWEILGDDFNLGEADGKVYEIEAQPGCELVLSFSISPLQNVDGEEEGYVISFSDMTRLRELEEQAKRNMRLAAMGEMSANLAHEIRNPLGSIKLFASILERNLESDYKNRQLATHIMESVDSLDSSVTNMLIYARSPDADFAEVSVQELLKGAVETASYAISQTSVTLNHHYDDCDAVVSGDQRFLKQALSNIVLNGVQAMPEGGDLIISTSITTAEELELKGTTIVSPNRIRTKYVAISIRDTGVGIPQSGIQKVFEPFFSTKTMGTGLGLAIVKRVVHKHDAFLLMSTSEGKGSEFTMALPLAR